MTGNAVARGYHGYSSQIQFQHGTQNKTEYKRNRGDIALVKSVPQQAENQNTPAIENAVGIAYRSHAAENHDQRIEEIAGDLQNIYEKPYSEQFAFYGAQRSPFRFRAAAFRSKTAA